MWIFLKDAFFSIVTCPNNHRLLTVRARVEGDIERVFARAKIYATPDRDYAFRAFIPRHVVARAIAHEVMTIEASNFKASVTEDFRHDAYLRVWGAALSLQDRRKVSNRQHSLDLIEGGPSDDYSDDTLDGAIMPAWIPRRMRDQSIAEDDR